jgi:nitroreductase
MEIYESIFKRRSIRRFKPNLILKETLKKLVRVGACAASGGNLQPWEFIVVAEPEKVNSLVEFSGWLAGAPEEGQRPTVFIVVLANTLVRKERYESDCAAACQNIILAAFAEGIGSCWIRSFKKDNIKGLLIIPEHLELYGLIALGYPDEEPLLEEIKKGDETLPHREEKANRLHIPKRRLEDIFHINTYGKKETERC